MLKTAHFRFVVAVLAIGVASPAFAKAQDNSDWRQTNLYDVVSPGPMSDSYAFDPVRAGGGSFGYNVNIDENY